MYKALSRHDIDLILDSLEYKKSNIVMPEARAELEKLMTKLRFLRDGMKRGANGETRMEPTKREQTLGTFHRLQSMLKANEPPPTDQEVKDDYVNYLEKKYS